MTSRRTTPLQDRPLGIMAAALATFVVMAALVYIAVRSPNGLPWRDYKSLYVEVADPGNLQRHNEVRIAGVRVGQVIGIKARKDRGLIELKLDPGVEALPSDTEAFVRGKGLLGARYVELRPGKTRETLRWRSTIRAGKDALTFGVPDALETFDARTRNALAQMVGQLGRGMLARGRELNAAIQTTPRSAREFRALAHEVLARPGAARRFVPSAREAAWAFDRARDDFARSLSPTAAALQPFRDRRRAVHSMLEEAPPTLSAMQSGLDEGRKLLAATRMFSSAVSDTLPAAPAGLQATTALMRESPIPLRRTADLLEAARPAVPDLLRITDALSPNLGPLRRAFRELHRLVRGVDPYRCDLDNGFDNGRSFIGYPQHPGGPIGPLNGFRSQGLVGPEAADPFFPPPSDDPLLRYEPHPPPCKYTPGSTYDPETGEPTGASRDDSESSDRNGGRTRHDSSNPAAEIVDDVGSTVDRAADDVGSTIDRGAGEVDEALDRGRRR